MRPAILLALPLILAAAVPARAQTPRWGFSFNIGFPVGDFKEKVFPPTPDVEVPQVEGYDPGFGGQFTVSFPLNRNLAFRAGLGGITSRGTNNAEGYYKVYCRHTIYSLSGELQAFFDDAYLYRGVYLVAGLSADSELFERADDDYWDWWSRVDESRKNRLGATAGIGYSFPTPGGFRFVTELSYHATLSGKDTTNPPNAMQAADFFKVSIGVVF